MATQSILSVIETPAHPDLSAHYRQLGFAAQTVTSMRKAISFVKKDTPDYLVAEFIYGYGNNYAGVNISNMDVLLYTLQRYSPNTRVIALVDRSEREHVDKLNDILPVYAIVTLPVTAADIESLLEKY